MRRMSSTTSAPSLRPLRQLRDLPGPPGWPLLGNSLQVHPARIHLDVEAWARQYGPVFRMRLGRHDQLVVADSELLAAVMRDRPDGWRRSPFTSRVGTEMGLPQGVFSAEGDEWRKQRRMVMAAFAPDHVRAYFPSLVKVSLRLRGRWLRAVQAGQAIPLQADLMRFTVDAIAGLAFGKDINTLEAGDDVIQRHLDKVLPAIFRRVLSFVPYWRWFKLQSDRDLDRSVAVINRTILEFVAQARQQLQDDPALRAQPRNLLQAMIAAADEPGSGLGDAQVAGNVLTMLLAGEDTTANTLAWMIHLLQRHPEALQRVRDEVRRVAPDPAAYRFEQMEQLVYLEACASETMRLKPVAPFIALQALRDTVVGDVAVPERTQLWGVLRHDTGLPPRTLAGRNAVEPGCQARRHTLRLGPAHVPGALPGTAGDEDGDGDAARQLRHRIGRYARRPARGRAHGVHDEPGGAELEVAGCGLMLKFRSGAEDGAAVSD
jgi:cytochrome P450